MSDRALFLVAVLTAAGCGSQGATPADATADGAALAEGSAGDSQGASCPSTQPSGACSSPGLTCGYGCAGCACQPGGQWYCSAPGCAGGCPGGTPPLEGTSCGGCCGASVGTTCPYACPAGGGQISATCQAPGAWHVSAQCATSGDAAAEAGDAAADVSIDAPADAGGDAACFGLFHDCSQTSQCCQPYACINITGTQQCQLEGPAIDAGR